MAIIEFPRKGKAGIMQLKNGQSENYGSDRIEDGYFYYFTGAGLRDMFNPNPNSQTEQQKKLSSDLHQKSKEELMASGHYAKMAVGDIVSFE